MSKNLQLTKIQKEIGELKEVVEEMKKEMEEMKTRLTKLSNLSRKTCTHPNATSWHGYFSCKDCGESGRWDE